MPPHDPLLQPYQLKHLALRNRIMSSAHEPACSVDGMPTDRYRLYHVEKARGGIALNMTAGAALVAGDSPAASAIRDIPAAPGHYIAIRQSAVTCPKLPLVISARAAQCHSSNVI